ncbi:MAG: polyhydroxyalkanoate synthesis regulator DNA-binding domain-containing protein [Myxococcota bacterium]
MRAGDRMPEEKKQPRVIKRYANRKLYDMEESRYITHDEIAHLVRDGEEVQIIDNSTKEDLTTLTLTQILFKEEKKQRKTLPLHTLRGLLQSSGDFIERHITRPVTSLRDEAEGAVRNVRKAVFRREDEEGFEDADGHPVPEHEVVAAATEPPSGEMAERATAEEASAVHEEDRGKPHDAVREWIESSQRSFENLQRTLEDRWDLVFNSLRHLDANRKRIAELEARVEELEARLGHAAGRAEEGSDDSSDSEDQA